MQGDFFLSCCACCVYASRRWSKVDDHFAGPGSVVLSDGQTRRESAKRKGWLLDHDLKVLVVKVVLAKIRMRYKSTMRIEW